MVTCLRAGMPHYGMQAWNAHAIVIMLGALADGHFMHS